MRLPIPANDNIKGVVLLRFPDLKTWKGITFSRSHLSRLEKESAFPKRVRIGANTIAWIESEVDDFIAARAAARQ